MLKTVDRFICISFLIICMLLVYPPRAGIAFSFGDRAAIVSINQITYSARDYHNWWQEWREANTPVPETADTFIDWMLCFQEAQQIGLFKNQRYRHKISVFLKSHSLMLLRQEEVNDRLKPPTKEQLMQEYHQHYQPRLTLQMVKLDDAAVAGKVKELIADGLELKEALITAGSGNVPVWQRQNVRPLAVEEDLQALFQTGEQQPDIFLIPRDSGYLLIRVLEWKTGSQDDYHQLKEGLAEKILRARTQQLNANLLVRLRRKYQPVIQEEKLAALEAENVDPETVVLEMNELRVTAGQLQKFITQERRRLQGRDRSRNAGTTREIAARVIKNMITQTLVSFEALDRHYEQRLPFRETFAFYCQHRLIKELEQEAIWPLVTVTEEEIRKEYEQHRKDYLQPAVIELAWVRTGNHRLVEILDHQLQAGEDFFTVMNPYFPEITGIRKVPETELPVEIRQLVDSLVPGQVSSRVTANGETLYVKLLRRHQPQPQPLAQVATAIHDQLRERQFAGQKELMIKKLRQRSTITLNERTWHKLRQRLLADNAQRATVSHQ